MHICYKQYIYIWFKYLIIIYSFNKIFSVITSPLKYKQTSKCLKKLAWIYEKEIFKESSSHHSLYIPVAATPLSDVERFTCWPSITAPPGASSILTMNFKNQDILQHERLTVVFGEEQNSKGSKQKHNRRLAFKI